MVAAQTLADVAAAHLLNAQARQDLQDSSDRSRQGSLHDSLTGLPNRVLLLERLVHARQRSRRTNGATGVYFIDLDLFKAVNDTHGHDIGDDLLIAVARRLTGMLRPADTLARLSGDEYVALCEDLTDPDQAAAIAARMATALSRPFPLTGVDVSVTASIGIAYADQGDARTSERLLRDADMGMYQAKHRGGARQQLFDPREQRLADRRAGLERDLHDALPRGQLHLEYQPIVATADGRITGFEALLRWRHPTLGMVPPTTLIPLAEQSRLITGIGAWVLDRAWADRNHWRRHRGGELTVAVNVSAHQVMSPGFTAAVAGTLNTIDMNPALLTLEITESVFIQEPHHRPDRGAGPSHQRSAAGRPDPPLRHPGRGPLSAVGLVLLVTGILAADTNGWAALALIAAGVLVLGWFYLSIRAAERAGREPLLSTALFRNRT